MHPNEYLRSLSPAQLSIVAADPADRRAYLILVERAQAALDRLHAAGLDRGDIDATDLHRLGDLIVDLYDTSAELDRQIG